MRMGARKQSMRRVFIWPLLASGRFWPPVAGPRRRSKWRRGAIGLTGNLWVIEAAARSRPGRCPVWERGHRPAGEKPRDEPVSSLKWRLWSSQSYLGKFPGKARTLKGDEP